MIDENTKISAKIIADSISPMGQRLTTMEVTFHRFILSELNTHRAFSRNSASSRARSVKKTILEVNHYPALPIAWPGEQPGMSGNSESDYDRDISAYNVWNHAAGNAVASAKALTQLGVHKSVVNRLLEPFMWHTAVITATDWDGFFAQRLALLDDGKTPAAQPEMYELARQMKAVMDISTPKAIDFGDCHLPYITDSDAEFVQNAAQLCQISIARCAGVSYLTQGATGRDPERDIALYQRLRNAKPPHWSPFEHVAVPAVVQDGDGGPIRFYNLSGWASYRWVEETTQR
jgi:hypothetical protein